SDGWLPRGVCADAHWCLLGPLVENTFDDLREVVHGWAGWRGGDRLVLLHDSGGTGHRRSGLRRVWLRCRRRGYVRRGACLRLGARGAPGQQGCSQQGTQEVRGEDLLLRTPHGTHLHSRWAPLGDVAPLTVT